MSRKSSLKGLLYSVSIVLLVMTNSIAWGQWRKLASFGSGLSGISCIYFIDSTFLSGIGFVGLRTIDTNEEEVWRTSDAGTTWERVFVASSKLDGSWVSSFTFKNNFIGWFGLHNFGGCYKTLDGGTSWALQRGTIADVSALYYNRINGKLFLSRWFDAGKVSDDDGLSWRDIPVGNTLNSFSTQDGINIITSSARAGSPLPNPYIVSSDGGVSWRSINFGEEAYQPTIVNGFIYCLSEDGSNLFVSTDFGDNWGLKYTFPFFVTGSIGNNSNGLFCQSHKHTGGIYKSTDYGGSWVSICGPSNYYDTRFFCAKDRLYAGDEYGNLYLNKSGTGNGVRVVLSNSKRQFEYSNKLIPVEIYYPSEPNYEPVDSTSISMNISGEMLGYVSDSVADGWSILGRDVTDSTLRYRLRRTGSKTPDLNSFMLRVFFKTFIARDTTAQVTLDEVNFNQDVTFRDCMVASLKATDTVTFTISDQCGDSTLRAFLHSKPVLEILSIFPNPTNGNITVDFSSLLERDVILQVLDDLGRVVHEEKLQATVGTNSRTIPIPPHWSGAFYLRLQMGKDVVTGKFVKQ